MTPDTPSQEIEATLRFRFAGEAVTQIARNHVAAGDWELGLRLLTEGVRGLGYSNAVAILRGELALEGVNTVGLVQQDPEAEGFAAWQQQVQYAYAGRFRLRGVWYRPYAVVENYGQQDAAWSAKRWGLKGDMARAPGNNRALYYANDPEADLALTMDYPGWMGLTTAMRVLFEVCTSPPVWMQHARTAEEALSAYVHVRGYTLERRSWSERHGAMDSEVRELYAQQRAYMLRREAEIDLEGARGMVRWPSWSYQRNRRSPKTTRRRSRPTGSRSSLGQMRWALRAGSTCPRTRAIRVFECHERLFCTGRWPGRMARTLRPPGIRCAPAGSSAGWMTTPTTRTGWSVRASHPTRPTSRTSGMSPSTRWARSRSGCSASRPQCWRVGAASLVVWSTPKRGRSWRTMRSR